MLDLTETIVAIASPPGPALRGLVRLSGAHAGEIASASFHPPLDPAEARGALRREGTFGLVSLGRTLPASLTWSRGPRTYTGEDLAEIHTLGSPPLLRAVLNQCLDRGARVAERGEFTLRAFLNGRIDLTRAEAVLGVIEARSPEQLDLALQQLAGGLARRVGPLRDQLLDVLAHIEAGLDFVEEEDVEIIPRAQLTQTLRFLGDQVAGLLRHLSTRERTTACPRVVLVGPPNAGKSRLFNAMTGSEQALVSPWAGTTRDYLSAPCCCAGVWIELIDTAGEQGPEDELSAQAQNARQEAARSADLLLECRPATDPAALLHEPAAARLEVLTKADLLPTPPPGLATSAATGSGIPELQLAIREALERRPDDGAACLGTGPRCRAGLLRAGDRLNEAAATLLHRGGDELVALDLRAALEELGQVLGQDVADDVLARIFQRFCVGK